MMEMAGLSLSMYKWRLGDHMAGVVQKITSRWEARLDDLKVVLILEFQ